jgi:hypothetical protein
VGLEPNRYGIPIPMKIGIQLYSGFRVAARNGEDVHLSLPRNDPSLEWK